jgi:hypothetical protein
MKRLLAILLGMTLLLTSCSVASVRTTVNYPQTIEGDGSRFVLQLKAGDRVEIEISNVTAVVSIIKDPFGNLVGQSATKTGYFNEYVPFKGSIDEGKWETRNYLVSTQQYPWRSAFIAAATGNYSVEVVSYIDYPHKAQYKEGHLKVTFNP